MPRQASRARSEEHTSELQSPTNLVCRLLLEKNQKIQPPMAHQHSLRDNCTAAQADPTSPGRYRVISCSFERIISALPPANCSFFFKNGGIPKVPPLSPPPPFSV